MSPQLLQRKTTVLYFQAVQVGSSRVQGETISKPYLTGGSCGGCDVETV